MTRAGTCGGSIAPTAPNDALAAGTEALATGTAMLRRSGYRCVAVVGESRGAFITLLALRQPGFADAVVALAPAAHGTRPERRPQALMDFRATLAAMAAQAPDRAGLVLFHDDPFDPDPAARAAAFREAMAARHVGALVIDRPTAPVGHGGASRPRLRHPLRRRTRRADRHHPVRPAS